MREDGELSFIRLFEEFDRDLEQRKQKLTSSFFVNHIDYAKEFGAVKAIETLRVRFTQIAEKARNEEE